MQYLRRTENQLITCRPRELNERWASASPKQQKNASYIFDNLSQESAWWVKYPIRNAKQLGIGILQVWSWFARICCVSWPGRQASRGPQLPPRGHGQSKCANSRPGQLPFPRIQRRDNAWESSQSPPLVREEPLNHSHSFIITNFFPQFLISVSI